MLAFPIGIFGGAPRMNFVINRLEELKQRVPGK